MLPSHLLLYIEYEMATRAKIGTNTSKSSNFGSDTLHLPQSKKKMDTSSFSPTWSRRCACTLFPLNVAITIISCVFPMIVIHINQMYGESMDQLTLTDGNDVVHELRGKDNLLQIKCIIDRFWFTLVAGEYTNGAIHGLEFAPVEFQYGYDEFGSVQDDVKMIDMEGPDGCIPKGLLGILQGQDWFELGDDSCSITFEKHSKDVALVCALLGILGSFLQMIMCCEDERKQCLNFSIGMGFTGFTGLCNIGSLVCVFPFGNSNMCGQQGDNTVHIIVIILIFYSAVCSLFLSISYVCCTFARRRRSLLIVSNKDSIDCSKKKVIVDYRNY